METRTSKPADEVYVEMGISEERAMFIMKYVESMVTKPEGFYTSEVIKAIQEEPEFDVDERTFATYILGIIQATQRHMMRSQSPFGVVVALPTSMALSGNPLAGFLEDLSKGMLDELPDDVDCENCDRTDCAHHPIHKTKKP